MKQLRTNLWFLVALLLAALGIAERVRFLLTSGRHLPVTGDEALAMLKASAITLGERPLLFWGTPYQFPLESYLLSTIVNWLPPTPFGARVGLFLLAVLSVGGFVLLTRLAFPTGSRWPVVLLVLFPSAYVITLQSAYFIPQHTMTMTFAWLLPVSALMALRSGSGRLGLAWTALTGIFAGVALSTHLLSLPIVAATSLVVMVGANLRTSIWRIATYLPSLALGLLPYLATFADAREMAAEVTGRYPLPEAVARLYSPVLWNNLTPVLGFDVAPFPELLHWRGYVPLLVQPLLIGFWLLLGYATFLSARRVIKTLRTDKRLQLSIHDLFVASVWASLLAFCFSTRAQPQQYRYLLPVAWGFPFLLGVVYTASGTRVRAGLAVVAVFLVGLNLAHTRAVVGSWQEPGFAAKAADLHPIDSVISYLDEQQIDSCYAPFWLTYRITFRTEKRILCDQPFNGRFLGWPLPFTDEFDFQERAAVVLSNTWTGRLSADNFQKMLDWHRVQATVANHSPYLVFHDFRYEGVTESQLVDAANISPSITGSSTESLAALIDADRSSTWRSALPQKSGKTLELRLDKPRVLHRVRIYFERGEIYHAPVYRIEVKRPTGEWQTVRSGIKPVADRLKIDEEHTRFYSDYRQDISFAPVSATGVRLVIEEPRSDKPWSIAKIKLSEDAAATPQVTRVGCEQSTAPETVGC